MLASLLTLGAKYVPSILHTIGGGIKQLIGKSGAIRTLGSKIRDHPIGNAVYNVVKDVASSLDETSKPAQLAITTPPITE